MDLGRICTICEVWGPTQGDRWRDA